MTIIIIGANLNTPLPSCKHCTNVILMLLQDWGWLSPGHFDLTWCPAVLLFSFLLFSSLLFSSLLFSSLLIFLSFMKISDLNIKMWNLGADHSTSEGVGGWFWKKISCKCICIRKKFLHKTIAQDHRTMHVQWAGKKILARCSLSWHIELYQSADC